MQEPGLVGIGPQPDPISEKAPDTVQLPLAFVFGVNPMLPAKEHPWSILSCVVQSCTGWLGRFEEMVSVQLSPTMYTDLFGDMEKFTNGAVTEKVTLFEVWPATVTDSV